MAIRPVSQIRTKTRMPSATNEETSKRSKSADAWHTQLFLVCESRCHPRRTALLGITEPKMAARVGKLAAESTSFFVCDLQERFRTAIVHFPEIVEVGRRLVAAAKILNIQTIVTEQNPKGMTLRLKVLRNIMQLSE